MSAEPKLVPQPGTWKRVVIGLTLALGLLLAAGGLAVWWTFFSPSLPWGPDMTGLHGVWHEEKNPILLADPQRQGAREWVVGGACAGGSG